MARKAEDILKEAIEAWMDHPACAEVVTSLPDGRRFSFNAIITEVTPGFDGPVGVELVLVCNGEIKRTVQRKRNGPVT